MKVSRKGVRFIERWEGYRREPYNDAAGHCTRGIGELIHLGACTGNEKPVGKRTARKRLRRSLNGPYLAPIRALGLDLRQCEVDALVSAAYNLGVGLISDPSFSTLARRLRSGEARTYSGRRRIYREELPRWDQAGGQQLAGLTARRHAEVRLANHADYSGRP